RVTSYTPVDLKRRQTGILFYCFFTLATPGNVLYRVIRALSKWREYLRDGSRLSIFLITE
ncbi:TPA: hypothetical protein ACYRSQ_005810, partial [Klebsiella michiganensis]